MAPPDFIRAALVASLAAGVTVAEFWTLTPYETRLYIDAYRERGRDEYRLALYTAWQTEAYARTKRMPKFADELAKLDKTPKKRKTGAEILAAVEAMNRASGGVDKRLSANG